MKKEKRGEEERGPSHLRPCIWNDESKYVTWTNFLWFNEFWEHDYKEPRRIGEIGDTEDAIPEVEFVSTCFGVFVFIIVGLQNLLCLFFFHL